MSKETETSTESEKIIWCDLPISNFIKTCFTYNLKQESRSRLVQISQISNIQVNEASEHLNMCPTALLMLDKKLTQMYRGFLVSGPKSRSNQVHTSWNF